MGLKEIMATKMMRHFAKKNIPLLHFVEPSIVKLTDDEIEIKIPFKKKNKNHLGSMYFGVLTVGADASGGVLAMKLIKDSGRKISLIFKDLKAEFYKRAEGDTHFVCKDGKGIKDLIQKVIETKERQNMPLHIDAYVPSKQREPVAHFVLTLSLKLKE
ncbi:conserved hypothetical protein [Thermotomaculum hydrothermale]|uniref:DUF4442 domain-containing protein n=1 Tax=Thermotomaculum hydrothermale TaxID=981385 RepID=A0A7R6PG58_9BACT|nr:DUF4442 domain-containing protein [Thermotomaculum hydrothermale]BBB33139.1 conserved hypothetical protein [Thermotomaculum hydrothermale]